MIKSLIKKFLPKNFLLFYHKMLAVLAGFFYGWPSEKLIVIGVTGTAGKSTTVIFIGKILEEAGFRVGWTSSVSFKIAEKEIENKTRMTMPGRFFMQKILKEMVKANCQYAIIETSSEGILQSRHLGINYDIAVFTNLSPEHIEAHGGFEKYLKTKEKLFKKLKSPNSRTKIIGGGKTKKIIVANLDDKYGDHFLSFPADDYYGFKIKNKNLKFKITNQNLKIIEAKKLTDFSFIINNLLFKLNLGGEFNLYNALAAISVSQAIGVPLKTAKIALEKIKSLPGRMEEVISQPFKVIVDYAHTPIELENVYRFLKSKIKNGKLICVFGSAGGGRDRWKRPVLGKLATQYCHYIILTNEDPYDEDPNQILSEIRSGISELSFPSSNLFEILDRKEAIKKAIMLAEENDVIIITGKGCEQSIMVKNNKKIPWDDRKVVKEIYQKIYPQIKI